MRRTHDQIHNSKHQERKKERKKEKKEGRKNEAAIGNQEARNVVTSSVTSATRRTLAAMHSWKNGVRGGRCDYRNTRGDGRVVERRGV